MERGPAMERRRRRTAAAVAASVCLAMVTACSYESAGRDPAAAGGDNPAADAASPQTVTTGLEAPWSITFHGGTPLVSERDSARILELDAQGNPREVGIISSAAGGGGSSGEGGLLGITVRDGYLYSYLTAGDENRIERRELTGGAGSLGLGSSETIVAGIEAGPIHNGGRLAFGPDGMLYASTGDAGNRDSAQDTQSLSGKILRMTPEGGAPEDNPFPGSLVYSYGHRNPQGLAWDAEGTLYSSEFGQNTWDELNVIEPGGNYGWPDVEGIAGGDGFIDPVQQWDPSEASPSGITVAGNFVYIANLRGERLRTVPLDDLRTSADALTGEYGRLRDAVTAPDGTVWVLTNNTDGRGRPGEDDDRILRLDESG